MIVKFWKPGTSFKGLVNYLTHDTGHAKTSERVSWTDTLNLVNDGRHISSAVDEMLWTFRGANLLKQQAGVHAGGSKVERPAKHISLNWHPSESPTKEDMIAAAEEFLHRMRWQEHQVILVAHTDRKHSHVHLTINAIHPITGRQLRDSYEWRRAQKWALAYERGRGKIFCEQRLKPAAEREPSPPRPVWLLLEQARAAHERAEAARQEGELHTGDLQREAMSLEWRVLKELQKEERLAWLETGRAAFKQVRNDVYRDVRREFAPEWNAIYRAKRAGADPAALAAVKADLIARQKEVLTERRDEACADLRLARDAEYKLLLAQQQTERADLAERQGTRLSTLDRLQERAERAERTPAAAEPPRGVEDETRRRLDRGGACKPQHHPFHWTERSGMVAQQRSASRYLDQIAARSRRAANDAAQVQQVVQQVHERLQGGKWAARAAGHGRAGRTDPGADPSGSD